MTKSKRRRAKTNSTSPDASKASPPSPTAAAPPSSRLGRRLLVAALGILCLVVVAAFWRPWLVRVSNQQAQSHLSAHRYEQARPWLDWSLSLNDNHAETHFLLARLHRKQGDAKQFERHLLRASELGADNERCRSEQWLALAQNGQMREAEPRYSGLLESPVVDAAEVCEAYANGYLLNGHFQQAMRILEGWQAADPMVAQPLFMQGLIWRHLGDYKKTEAKLREALTLAPDHGPAALVLAELLAERGRGEEALPLFRQAASHPALRQQAVIGEAGVLRTLNQSDAARECLRQVLEQAPENPDALGLLGQLELAAGHTEDAERMLRQAFEQRPRDVELRYVLATALSAAGKQDEAAVHYQAVAEARPALAQARETMIRLNDEPGDLAGRTDVGRTLLQYGKPEDGVIWLQSALEVDPSYAPAHRALADYYEGPGADLPQASTLALYHRQQAVGGDAATLRP